MDEAPIPPAAQRRLDAIRALVVKYLGEDQTRCVADDQREAVAFEIRSLAPLGRTERWRGAIETWALAVERREDATHALLQWSIFAGYAAL